MAYLNIYYFEDIAESGKTYLLSRKSFFIQNLLVIRIISELNYGELIVGNDLRIERD